MSVDRTPWHHGQIQLQPAGLRDCVLRVAFMHKQQLREMAYKNGFKAPTLWQRVARWRLEQPEQWNELLKAMDLDVSMRAA